MKNADQIWKALADETRRGLLDLLKPGPQTTGALAAQFRLSRFGVMKHLGVLEEAGLVVVRRRGRQRFNYLNAVPIREIYERWIGPFSEFWSQSLLGAKRFAEQLESAEEPGANGMKEFKNGEGLDRYEIAQEVVIKASTDKVWKALTTDIGAWWAFRLADGEVSLDAKIGGHFVEKAADGSGALWGVVTQIKQGSLLRLEGQLGMTDIPVKSHYTYEVEGKGNETLLKLTHHCFGQLSPESGAHHNEGWKLLLGKHLKEYLEEGKTSRVNK